MGFASGLTTAISPGSPPGHLAMMLIGTSAARLGFLPPSMGVAAAPLFPSLRKITIKILVAPQGRYLRRPPFF